MLPPRVAVVVINWNKLDVTRECLDQLGLLEYPNHCVYVLDNGSEEKGIEAELARFTAWPCAEA